MNLTFRFSARRLAQALVAFAAAAILGSSVSHAQTITPRNGTMALGNYTEGVGGGNEVISYVDYYASDGVATADTGSYDDNTGNSDNQNAWQNMPFNTTGDPGGDIPVQNYGHPAYGKGCLVFSWVGNWSESNSNPNGPNGGTQWYAVADDGVTIVNVTGKVTPQPFDWAPNNCAWAEFSTPITSSLTGVTATSMTYNGASQTTSLSVSPSTATYNPGGTLSATNVGSYTASATGTGNYGGTVYGGWSIVPAALTGISATSFIYNGGSQTTSLSVSPGGATYTPGGTLSATIAGSYTATATGTGNYGGVVSTTWSISTANQPAPTISPSATTILMGQSVTFTASGGAGTGAYVWGGSASGSSNPTSVTFNSPGSFTVTLYRNGDGNYNSSPYATPVTITVSAASQSTVSISPVTSSINVGQSILFTASGGSGSGTYTWSSPSGGATGTTDSVTFNSPGIYGVNVYRTGDSTYAQSNTAYATVTVSLYPVTFTVAPVSFTYNGLVQGPTITPSPSGATWASTGTASSPTAGVYSVTAQGTGSYGGNSGPVSWTIAKATPTVTWSNPSAITYGTFLSGAQLNATASVPGSFAYSPAAGTILGASSGQTLSVTFTPTDSTDYNGVIASATIVVNKATPVLSWIPPTAITYGTPLGGAQLDATATFGGSSVPGTFVYTPAAGAILNAGAGQTLLVTYTPTDTTDYNTPAGGSTTITVNLASVTFSIAPTTFVYTGAAQGPTITPSIGAATWSVTSGTASATNVGAYSVSAAANGNYSGSGSTSWSITQAPQTITAVAYPSVISTAQTSTVSVSGGLGTGAVTYSIVSGPGTVNSATGVVTPSAIGSIVVLATKAADANYSAATATVPISVNSPGFLSISSP